MIEISVVFVLLLISGAFSGTEVAFTSLSVDQIERMKKENGARGRHVADLYDHLDVVLTSITIGNNLANLAASALVSAFTIRMFGETWLTASTLVLTILVLILGEVTPKQIGIMHNERVTLGLSRFLQIFSTVFSPFIWMIRTISNGLTRLTGSTKRPRVTIEGLHHLVRYAGSEGLFNQLNASVLKNVFRSREVRVGAIMTHRTKVFSLEKRSTVQEVFPAILESGFSRIPVYDGEPERIVGILLVKDVAKAVADGNRDMPISKIVVPPVFVPESKSFHIVLSRLRRERLNMAIVLDEYGGVAGIVTVEDLVEEFVGELYDEGEIEETQPLFSVGPGEYIIAGDAPIHVVNDHLDVNFPSDDDAQT
ncbi:MAG TPA: hemolysin family protein, partial [Alkalispirochaeta sp.]|nr:hemolysin family protein [Alkalispirochaeta sp.]